MEGTITRRRLTADRSFKFSVTCDIRLKFVVTVIDIMASPESAMEAPTVVKKALACYGQRKREILFNANVSAAQELNNLRAAFLASYNDVAELRNAQISDLIVQAKSELWSGQFVNVQDQYIPNHSVLNVILATPTKAVSRLNFCSYTPCTVIVLTVP